MTADKYSAKSCAAGNLHSREGAATLIEVSSRRPDALLRNWQRPASTTMLRSSCRSPAPRKIPTPTPTES